MIPDYQNLTLAIIEKHLSPLAEKIYDPENLSGNNYLKHSSIQDADLIVYHQKDLDSFPDIASQQIEQLLIFHIGSLKKSSLKLQENADLAGFRILCVLNWGIIARILIIVFSRFIQSQNYHKFYFWCGRVNEAFSGFFRPLCGSNTTIVLQRIKTFHKKPVKDLSVVIPAYNEEKRLPAYLKKIHQYFKKSKLTFEIIIVDDGSKDNTQNIIKKMNLSEVKILTHKKNRGKGAAVRSGVLNSGGNFILVADADGATAIEEFEKLNGYLSSFDIAIASRYLQNSSLIKKQSFIRRLISRSGNFLIRLIAELPFQDTQCGFKLFSRESAQLLFRDLKFQRFSFDVEILRKAKLHSFSVKEVPISWNDQPGSTVTAWDVPKVFFDVIRIRFSYFLKFVVVGIVNTFVDYSIHNILIILFGKGDNITQIKYHISGFIGANLVSFILNASFTFQRIASYCLFLSVSLLSLFLSSATFYSLNSIFNDGNNIWIVNMVKLVSILVSMLVNYFGYKIMVFKVR